MKIDATRLPTQEEITAIELRARQMRAEAVAGGLRAAVRGLGRLAARLVALVASPARA